MGFLKRILDFYIFSNIHVAIAGFCITKISLLKYAIDKNYVPFFVAFSIVISYNFIRFYEVKTNQLQWLKKWLYTNKVLLLVVSLISLVGMLAAVFKINLTLNSILILATFSFMTVFYIVPIFKIGGLEISFRNFPCVKIYSIAIAWAGISVLFALSVYKIDFTKDIWIEFIQRFFILIAITLPFDIRDVVYDAKELKTIPQLIGIKWTKIVGVLLLVVFILFELFKEEISLKSTVLISVITVLFLLFSSSKRDNYYTAFWVESIPIFWLLILMYF